MKKVFLALSLLLVGCSTLSQSPISESSVPLDNYKYVYIPGTSALLSGEGYTGGTVSTGVYGSSTSKTVNPADVISGFLMKKGFAKLPQLDSALLGQTLIVSYGESDRRPILGGLAGYSIETTIQFLDAATNEIVASTTASGYGDTEADDIRKAILKSLRSLFEQ